MTKKSVAELSELIEETWKNSFGYHKTWQHYKGDVYEVLGFAVDTVDGTLRVRYKCIAGEYAPNMFHYTDVEFVRPVKEWFEDVELGQFNGGYTRRFVPVHKVERWEEKCFKQASKYAPPATVSSQTTNSL